MEERTADWTLAGLCAAAAQALAGDYQGPPNGRVRAVPDPRTVRYYGTLGLIDKPARGPDGSARYGPRQLAQLVAIKRLQAEGRSLVAIQEELLGRTDAEVAAIARLSVPAPPGPTAATRARFWAERPAAEAVETWHELDVAPGVRLRVADRYDRALRRLGPGRIRAALAGLLRELTDQHEASSSPPPPGPRGPGSHDDDGPSTRG